MPATSSIARSRALWLAIAAFAACLQPDRPATAQCTPEWLPGQGLPGAYGIVYATTAWDPDGPGSSPPLLVAGGNLLTIGDVQASDIVTWDGAEWQPLGSTSGAPVTALFVHNGGLFAGTTGGVIRWNGAAWLTVGSANGTVLALTAYGTDLIAGGEFTTINGVEAARIARWDGVSWHTLATGMTGLPPGYTPKVLALTTHGGDLIAGGSFGKAGEVSATNIARWNGASWAAMGTFDPVQALTIHEGAVVAAGGYTIARWSGSAWQAYPGLGSSVGLALTTYNGQLIVAGQPDKVRRWNGAAWEIIGTAAGAFYPPPSVPLVYAALTVYDGELVLGGSFSSVSGVGASAIALWNGARWRGLGDNKHGIYGGVYGGVQALHEFNGDLVAGGRFAAAGSVAASNIARWDGVAWHNLAEGITGTPFHPWDAFYVSALTEYHRDLIAGGFFNKAGTAETQQIAAWDGASWRPLGAGLGHTSEHSNVAALATFHGDLIAGGAFTVAGSAPVAVARWNGSTWSSMPGLTGYTYALVVHDAELIAGGQSNTSTGFIARWNGAGWAVLGTASGWTPAAVRTLGEYGGHLIAGGLFQNVDSVPAAGIARWDGAAWHSVGAGFTGNKPHAYALTVHDGRLVAGGPFTGAGSSTVNAIAAWDGAAWHAFGSGMQNATTLPVWALHSFRGELVAGGDFLFAGGRVSVGWARWGCEGCYPDCNADGALTVQDFGCFQTGFFLNDPYADCNTDGALTIADFGCFQTRFVAGCP